MATALEATVDYRTIKACEKGAVELKTDLLGIERNSKMAAKVHPSQFHRLQKSVRPHIFQMKEYLSNEEVWLDPSDRIRNLDKGEVEVRNYPKEGSEKHGSFSVSEPPAGIPGFGKCSLMIFFPNVLNAEWTDLGPPPRGPSMANGEKVFLTQAAIEMIRPHNIPQFHYLLELPVSASSRGL